MLGLACVPISDSDKPAFVTVIGLHIDGQLGFKAVPELAVMCLLQLNDKSKSGAPGQLKINRAATELHFSIQFYIKGA
jgi:hypothetical protein